MNNRKGEDLWEMEAGYGPCFVTRMLIASTDSLDTTFGGVSWAEAGSAARHEGTASKTTTAQNRDWLPVSAPTKSLQQPTGRGGNGVPVPAFCTVREAQKLVSQSRVPPL